MKSYIQIYPFFLLSHLLDILVEKSLHPKEFYLDLKEILEETDIDLDNAFSYDMQYNQKNREISQKTIELSQENVEINQKETKEKGTEMHEKKIEASNEKAKEYIKTKRTKNVGIPLNIDELAAYIAGGSL